MIRRRHWTGVIVAVLALQAGVARGHPHVWVKAASEIIYDDNGAMKGVRHAWSFDEMFTSYALQGLAPKVKGVYSREELAPLAQTNITSLKEFDYFTFAEVDGQAQKFAAPVDYYFEYQGEALVLHFTLPFETPFKAKQLTLQVFDPEYFVEISLRDEEPIKLVGAPKACTVTIQRPTDEESTEKMRAQDGSGDRNNSFGAAFADRITAGCP